MATKKSKIQIEFVGQNSHEVTGSCVWIKTPHKQILLECGLWQSAGDVFDDYRMNAAHLPFNPAEIDYVFVGHTHIDHCGKIPLLFKRRSNAKVIMPNDNTKIAEILLYDCAKIAAADAEEISKRFGREYTPLYDNDDVARALYHISEYPFNEIIELDEYVKFRFVPSGHILNAAQIELWITEGNLTKKIAYSSDLGNIHVDKYYVNKFSPIEKADIFIGETTYGGEKRIANQGTRKKDVEKIRNTIIETCVDNHGRVLIPVFANSRSQEILTVLYDIFANDRHFNIPVICDTPMGCNICNAYDLILEGGDLAKWQDVRQWKNVKFVSDAAESRAIMNGDSPCVVLSSSGMMTQGRSRMWCEKLLGSERNTIILCGFAVENSLASIIKSGKAKKIKLHGKYIPNKCRVVDLHSFSSHMQRDSLMEYYSSVECEKVLLVHGAMDNKLGFAEDLKEAISKNNKTSKVICVNKDYSLTI